MARTTLVRVLAATASAAAVVALVTSTATAGPASAPVEPADAVHGDFDGDGVTDRAALVPDASGGYALRVELATGSETAALPQGWTNGAGLRVTDLDLDAIAEIVVPVQLGANTVTYQVFRHEPGTGPAPLAGLDGDPFALYAGGGVAAVSGYGCVTEHDGRSLVVVGVTQRDDLPAGGELRYAGSRTTYAVADGVVTVVHTDRIEDAAATDPILQTDPQDCAPAG